MSAYTLVQAQTYLSEWLTALTSISKNQSYAREGRILTRADLGMVSAEVDKWTERVSNLERTAAGKSRNAAAKANFVR